MVFGWTVTHRVRANRVNKSAYLGAQPRLRQKLRSAFVSRKMDIQLNLTGVKKPAPSKPAVTPTSKLPSGSSTKNYSSKEGSTVRSGPKPAAKSTFQFRRRGKALDPPKKVVEPKPTLVQAPLLSMFQILSCLELILF